jgi:hypothetical protein
MGSLEFPFDMLRYDGCYPASNAYVQGGFNDNLLNMCMNRHDATKEQYYENRQVVLIKPVTYKEQKPTEGRWRSFGWVVTQMQYNP